MLLLKLRIEHFSVPNFFKLKNGKILLVLSVKNEYHTKYFSCNNIFIYAFVLQ